MLSFLLIFLVRKNSKPKFVICYTLIKPSVFSVVQILTSAVCMGPAVSPVATLKAPTPAHVWRATCRSQTTAHARPRMVSKPTSAGHQFLLRLCECSLLVPPVNR